MGWTSYRANYYKHGKVDRKAELDNNLYSDDFICLKSSLVGSVYYAACKNVITGNVFALIVKTSVENDDFSYKEMDESAHPYYYDCPLSILKLLTPTEIEWANEWRKGCYEKHAKDTLKKKNGLNSLPLGTTIEVTIPNDTTYFKAGTTLNITKIHHCMYKRPIWKANGHNIRFKTSQIESYGYKVL